MRSSTLFISCAIMFLPAAALAQESATAPVMQKASTDSGDRVICHLVGHEGGIVRGKECHTQAEWDRLMRTEQQDIRFQLNKEMTQQPH
jgi:hypothetical protein